MKKLLGIIAIFALVLAPVMVVTANAQSDDEYLELFGDIETTDTTSTSDDGAAAIISGIYLLCCCAGVLFWGAISYFVVYKDAVKSGVDNPTLWFVVTFFLGILGLILYFLVGKKK